MKFIKRKDGRCQYNLELPKKANGDRDRKCLIANTQKELKEMVADAQLKLKMGYNFKAEKLTVGDYLTEWLKIYCAKKAPSTKSGYKNYINNHIIPKLGTIKITKLLPMHIINFYNEEAEAELSGTTIKQEHAILRKAFNDAVKNGLLVSNPASKIGKDDLPETKKFESRIPTPEEVSMMMQSAKGTVHELPIILAGILGLRRSEVFGLTWGDIDFKTDIMTVRNTVIPVEKKLIEGGTKNETSTRELVVPEKVMEVFKRYRGLPGGKVCLNEKGLPQSVKSYNGRLTNFLKKHKIPHIRFHDLRHYNATLMLWLGIDSKKAATRLGHSTPAITQKLYQHVTWDMDKEVADKINRTI